MLLYLCDTYPGEVNENNYFKWKFCHSIAENIYCGLVKTKIQGNFEKRLILSAPK